MEDELHQKVGEYLSVTDETSSSHVPASDIASDIPSDAIANNDDTWMEPKCSYQ